MSVLAYACHNYTHLSSFLTITINETAVLQVPRSPQFNCNINNTIVLIFLDANI